MPAGKRHGVPISADAARTTEFHDNNTVSAFYVAYFQRNSKDQVRLAGFRSWLYYCATSEYFRSAQSDANVEPSGDVFVNLSLAHT